MALRFGTDGVRGVAVSQLTPSYVLDLGRAAARSLDGDTLLVARDTRVSGPLLVAAFAAGAAAEGVTVVDLGVLPTPALARIAVTEGLPAAMVTASHNPFADNGVKLFAVGGRKLPDEVERGIEVELAGLADPTRSGDAVGRIVDRADGADAYLAWLTSVTTTSRRLRVVIDCANGAMSDVAPRALVAAGHDLVVLHADPNGININAACGATHPHDLAAAVVAHGADVGLAFDGDGDRVIAVDETGVIVDGDRLIGLSAFDMRDRGVLAHETVVVTVMANLGFHRAMAHHGISVAQTAVGDRYVLEAMEAGGFSLGGEQSGHIIYGDLATTGDGLLAGMVLLDIVGRSAAPLGRLAADVMTTFPQVLVNVPVRERHPHIAEELSAEIEAAQAALGDDGRVLLRASGTEPLVRVMVEAATDADAHSTADSLAAVVRARFA
jgi:phosphoglucosamine mutase